MKNNSSILSVISLCLSVGIILVWIFSNFKLEIIDLSTFIGASVGLIGVMVTFAIGFQIYNALELKQNNERAIMKIKRTELKINRDRENNVIQFKVLNDNIENVIKRFEISSEIRMCYNMGMSAVPFGNYVMVICNFFEAYLHCMDYLDYKDFEDNISTYYIGDPEETIHTPDLNSIKNKILFYLTEYLGDPIVDSEFEEKISIIRYSNFLKYVNDHRYGNDQTIKEHLGLIENTIKQLEEANTIKINDYDNYSDKIKEIQEYVMDIIKNNN